MTDKKLCACCGVNPIYRHRSLCMHCLAALREAHPPPNPNKEHLELLRATGHDYDG